jgi:hypothetical protein
MSGDTNDANYLAWFTLYYRNRANSNGQADAGLAICS